MGMPPEGPFGPYRLVSNGRAQEIVDELDSSNLSWMPEHLRIEYKSLESQEAFFRTLKISSAVVGVFSLIAGANLSNEHYSVILRLSSVIWLVISGVADRKWNKFAKAKATLWAALNPDLDRGGVILY